MACGTGQTISQCHSWRKAFLASLRVVSSLSSAGAESWSGRCRNDPHHALILRATRCVLPRNVAAAQLRARRTSPACAPADRSLAESLRGCRCSVRRPVDRPRTKAARRHPLTIPSRDRPVPELRCGESLAVRRPRDPSTAELRCRVASPIRTPRDIPVTEFRGRRRALHVGNDHWRGRLFLRPPSARSPDQEGRENKGTDQEP